MVSYPSFVCYFRASDESEDFGGKHRPWDFGGGGSGGAGFTGTMVAAEEVGNFELPRFLGENAATHASTTELGAYLTGRVRELIGQALREQGHMLGEPLEPTTVVECSYDRARARLAGLMSSARENLVATITKRDSIDDAIALMYWPALDFILNLAEKGLSGEQKFGDLVTERVPADEAATFTTLDIHRPLAYRQAVAERRAVREQLRDTE
jgi:hypothetical protein